MPMPSPFLPSDQELWLLWVLSEYVLATRDKAFLEERIPLYPRQEVKDESNHCGTGHAQLPPPG